MSNTVEIGKKTQHYKLIKKQLYTNYSMGNDGNEFKIITQVFLYKFLNDKFVYEVKQLDKKLAKAGNLQEELKKYKKSDYELLMMQLSESTAQFKPAQFIATLFEKQNEPKFAEIFDNTLLDIAKENSDIFSVVTESGEKIVLFENVKQIYKRQA